MLSGVGIFLGARCSSAFAEDDKPFGDGPVVFGSPQAKVIVTEWMSLDCSHCANFSEKIFPKIKEELIDKGLIRYQIEDSPNSMLALEAAVVARNMPRSRYLPFISSLFSSQDRWAFNHEITPPDANLQKMAGLAGMPKDVFDKLVADQAVRDGLLKAVAELDERYHITGTPSFLRWNQDGPGLTMPSVGDAGVSFKSGEISSFDEFKAFALGS